MLPIDETLSENFLLLSADGAQAELFKHGAHITSWIPAGGEERLFLSKTSRFGPNDCIRGGVPLIFPQFASEGPLVKHGFARKVDWQLLNIEKKSDHTTAALQLCDNDATHQIWPYVFLAQLDVTVGGKQLEMALSITNTGQEPFTFTGALHTYLKVANIADTSIKGLGGVSYINSADRQSIRFQQEEDLFFMGEMDRFYIDAPAPLTLCEKANSLNVEMAGFRDVVIWNPWIEKGEALDDLEPQGYQHMLCIEAARINRPVTLAPTETWTGIQRLVAG